MRIALVAPSSDPLATHLDPGSATEAARVLSLARELAAVGHRVTVYSRKDSPALPASAIAAPGVTVEYVTAGPAEPLGEERLKAHLPEFGDYLTRRWRRNLPDIAHAHGWTMGLAALAGARGLGVPVALTLGSLGAAERRLGLPGGPSDARIRLEACIARSADVVLASSAAERADLARLGVPRTKVRVVPCGVDTQQFSPEGPAAERNGRPRLVAAESLAQPESLTIAVQALAEVPDAELVITGGPDKAALAKDQARRELMRLAKALGVADRLVFTGRITPADLPALLRSADVLVSASPCEPVGMIALQAMACGTPVVASAAGAAPDAIVDMTTGLLTPPGRPDQLAMGIRRLLASSLRREACGIAAADRARSRYPWERIARETAAAYACCARRPAATARAQAAEPDRDGDGAGHAVRPARRREAAQAQVRRVPVGARA
jgi:glycosyltransferase involved in cell wall biosynthesis